MILWGGSNSRHIYSLYTLSLIIDLYYMFPLCTVHFCLCLLVSGRRLITRILYKKTLWGFGHTCYTHWHGSWLWLYFVHMNLWSFQLSHLLTYKRCLPVLTTKPAFTGSHATAVLLSPANLRTGNWNQPSQCLLHGLGNQNSKLKLLTVLLHKIRARISIKIMSPT